MTLRWKNKDGACHRAEQGQRLDACRAPMAQAAPTLYQVVIAKQY